MEQEWSILGIILSWLPLFLILGLVAWFLRGAANRHRVIVELEREKTGAIREVTATLKIVLEKLNER